MKFKKLPLDDNMKPVTKPKLFKSPRSNVIISVPKSGKTNAMINKEKLLICDAENGTGYFDANNVANIAVHEGDSVTLIPGQEYHVPTGLFELAQEIKEVNSMLAFRKLVDQWDKTPNKKLFEEIHELVDKMVYPIAVIDTLTGFTSHVYECALADYNRLLNKKKTDIKKVDNYGGAQYIRRSFETIKGFIERNIAPFIIYTGHIKLKKSSIVKADEDIMVEDLALEGIIPTIFTSSADAVGVFYRNDEGCYISYKKKGDSDQDARCEILANRIIKISDLHQFDDNGVITKHGKTYWDLVYPEIFKTNKL